MQGRKRVQLTFADLQGAQRVPPENILRQILAAIDWRPVEAQLAALYPAVGRPGHVPLTLFRALLLRRWFGLSDPGLEAGLCDRLSWQYFCGLSLLDPVPDETTFCRFRRRLAQAGLGDSLFCQVEEALVSANLRPPG